jgi:hypothetical protein
MAIQLYRNKSPPILGEEMRAQALVHCMADPPEIHLRTNQPDKHDRSHSSSTIRFASRCTQMNIFSRNNSFS